MSSPPSLFLPPYLSPTLLLLLVMVPDTGSDAGATREAILSSHLPFLGPAQGSDTGVGSEFGSVLLSFCERGGNGSFALVLCCHRLPEEMTA